MPNGGKISLAYIFINFSKLRFFAVCLSGQTFNNLDELQKNE